MSIMLPHRESMASILERSLVYVTGKGGVGRSTVAGALGLVASARGRRTIVCEVAERGQLPGVFGRELEGPEELELADGLWATSIDPQAALEEWLRTQVGGPLVRLLAQSSAFQYFVAAPPRARELVTIVKGWELAARAALRAARGEYAWSRGQQGQLRRLRRAVDDAEVVTLPFLFEPELGREQLERLSGELDRKLGRR